MTAEESTQYYHLHGKKKYKDIGEDNDYYVTPKTKSAKSLYEYRFKKKGMSFILLSQCNFMRSHIPSSYTHMPIITIFYLNFISFALNYFILLLLQGKNMEL